jgi:hypothetical protein
MIGPHDRFGSPGKTFRPKFGQRKWNWLLGTSPRARNESVLERPELARHEALRLEVVRIGRHVHRRREAGMRDGSVVALEEVLARDLPVRRELRLGPEAELQRVQVDDLGQLRGDVAERFGEGWRLRVRVEEHEWPQVST